MSEADLRKMVFQKRGTEYIFSKELERAEVWEEAGGESGTAGKSGK